MTRAAIALGLLVASIPGTPPAWAANSTTPGPVTVYSTIRSAGFEWAITGDDDNDCAVTLEYRRHGDAVWKPAQPLLRVQRLWPSMYGVGNLLAGSLFFLQPGTAYEARLTLSDPDGGADQRIVGVTTRTEPQFTPTRTLYVAPGSGGGTGTLGDPFRGLAAADAQAQPGDLFQLLPGAYHGTFRPTRDGTAARPIVYRGMNQPAVLLVGAPVPIGYSHSVDLYGRSHVWIEHVSLTGCRRPLRADSTVGVVVRGCYVRPVPDSTRGISAGNARDLFIADNFVQMPGDWAGVGRTGDYGIGGYGILVEGTGHVICRNKIVEAWDAISIPVSETQVPAVVTSNVDIYENLVDRASDDGVQADAIRHNVRIFRNRLMNTGSGVSLQPCFGGPAYVLFNEIFNARIYPYKLHQETSYRDTQETSGFLICHNTTFSNRHAWKMAGYWHAGRIRNNLMLGAYPNVSLEMNNVYPGASLDHDGYNRVSGQSNLVYYRPTYYANLPAFYTGTGNEQHGVEVTLASFVSAVLPHHPEWTYLNGYGAPYSATDFDLRLAASSPAADAGQVLANVNDGYLGAAPDLGCYERGAALPVYGPALAVLPYVGVSSAAHDLSLATGVPNPFRAATRIAFTLPRAATVELGVYDVRGALVRTLASGERGAGSHVIEWNGRNDAGRRVPAGLYFHRLKAGDRQLARRVILLP